MHFIARLALGLRLYTPSIIAFGRGVSPSNQSQRCDRHLAAQRLLDLLVDGALQLDGTQWLAAIERGFAYSVLHRAESEQCPAQISIIGQDDGDSTLYLHMLDIPHTPSRAKTYACGS